MPGAGGSLCIIHQQRDHDKSITAAAWLLLLLLLVLPAVGAEPLACESTGHCSLGKLKPFFGDITPAAGLKAMLEARTWKRELVLVASTADWTPFNAHPYLHMKRLGMEHLMMMSVDENDCRKVAAKLPDVGCAWNSVAPGEARIPDLHGMGIIWWLRYRTLLRTVRLGYNVYSMDGDSIIYNNFYNIVEAPWAKHVVWWNQVEGGWGLNGGQVYIRNAKQDGPAVHTLWTILNVPLRWNDDNWEFAKSKGILPQCMYMDQDAMNVVMVSQLAGKGTLTMCQAWMCVPEEERPQGAHCEAVPEKVENETIVQLDGNLVGLADTRQYGFKTRTLRILHTKGWPNGRMWPEQKGNYSNSLKRLLEEDCPTCPPLLDPEDPATQAAAAVAPTEALAVMPSWFTQGYYDRGIHGYWHHSMLGGQPVKQAVGHLWGMHLAADTHVAKVYALQSTGMFDWNFTRAGMDNKELYPACYEQGHPLVHAATPANSSCEGLKVLAWHPDVQLQQTASPFEFSLVQRGMAQLAALLNRTLVWPDLPCNATRYISKRRAVQPGELFTYQPGKLPLDVHNSWFPFGDFRCVWSVPLCSVCHNKGRSMQVFELQDYLQRLPPGSITAPTPGSNIIGASTSTTGTPATTAIVTAAVATAPPTTAATTTAAPMTDHQEQQAHSSLGGDASSSRLLPGQTISTVENNDSNLIVGSWNFTIAAADKATHQEVLKDITLLARILGHRWQARHRHHTRNHTAGRTEADAPLRTLLGSSQQLHKLHAGAGPLDQQQQQHAGKPQLQQQQLARRLRQARKLLRQLTARQEDAQDATAPGPSNTLSAFIKGTVELSMEQVLNFAAQNPALMQQPVLYLTTPVRVKEMHQAVPVTTSSKGPAAPTSLPAILPEVARQALEKYSAFVKDCHAFQTETIEGRYKDEYRDRPSDLQPLMQEGNDLALAAGKLVAA